jgi:hypothetical protein
VTRTWCQKLIINALPWTNAEYEQLVGRLFRQGSRFNKVGCARSATSRRSGSAPAAGGVPDADRRRADRRAAPAPPPFINTHFNHEKELTPEARAACERLVDAGIPVGNQSGLLRGVNSSVRSLSALMPGLVRSRLRPYYLFQGDTVLGTDHLRTPVEAAIESTAACAAG